VTLPLPYTLLVTTSSTKLRLTLYTFYRCLLSCSYFCYFFSLSFSLFCFLPFFFLPYPALFRWLSSFPSSFLIFLLFLFCHSNYFSFFFFIFPYFIFVFYLFILHFLSFFYFLSYFVLLLIKLSFPFYLLPALFSSLTSFLSSSFFNPSFLLPFFLLSLSFLPSFFLPHSVSFSLIHFLPSTLPVCTGMIVPEARKTMV
jgi:hypothetical protein